MIEKILEKFRVNKIYYRLNENLEVISIKDVNEKLGLDKNKCIKTLVFNIKGEIYIIAIRGIDKLDYKKLAIVLSVKREYIKMADKYIIEEVLGYEIGGIAPFSENENIKIIYDKNILKIDNMYCGAGSNLKTLEICCEDLIKYIKPKIVDIVKEDGLNGNRR